MPLRSLPFLFILAITSFAAAADDEGFTPLFNGKDLTGWHNVQCAPSTWTVRDNMIISTGKPIGVLRTDRHYENFILELEYKHIHKGGNAGLFIWSDPVTARGQPFTRSIEVQILDGHETANYTSHGDIFAIHGATMKPDRPHPGGWMRCLPSEKRAKPAGEWNHYRVTANNGTLKLAVNGKEVSGGFDMSPRKGYICLESEGSECHFRNIKIKELPSSGKLEPKQIADLDQGFRSLYNGVDFTGWDYTKEHEGHWKSKDWVIDYDGKAGDLWSKEEFGDIQLMVDWRFTAKPKKVQRPVILPNGDYVKDDKGGQKMVEVDDAGDSGIYLRG